MDFDGAIAAHTEWKTKLRAYLTKHDGSLTPATVGVDNQCSLGKWMYGDGAKFASQPDFAALKAEHAKFHRCAAAVITETNAGNFDKAKALLDGNGEYARTSTSVVSAIMKVRKSAA